MSIMRAKLAVQSVEGFTGCDVVKMAPVCGGKPFGPNGESEDNTFARYTPGGEVKLNITNPELMGKFKPGQKFYADFTEAAE